MNKEFEPLSQNDIVRALKKKLKETANSITDVNINACIEQFVFANGYKEKLSMEENIENLMQFIAVKKAYTNS